MLAWEYCTLAHCRSAASIAFLPKLNVLYFLAAHGTFYAVSRPYALLNCGVAALFMAHATLYCILELELPALVRGDIDDAMTPRARRTELRGRRWTHSCCRRPGPYMPLRAERRRPVSRRRTLGNYRIAATPPPPEDEDDGVELVDLNRAPAPAMATSRWRCVFFPSRLDGKF